MASKKYPVSTDGNLLKGCWTYSKDEPKEHDKLTVNPNCDQYEIRSNNGSRVIGRPRIAENL